MLFNKDEYLTVLKSVKSHIRRAQYQALVAANKEMITLYWDIGNAINEHSVWGNKFIDNLSRDIKLEFPGVTGFSVRNLKYMAKFAGTWTRPAIVQRALHNLPWRHNIVLMEKIKKNTDREWYAAKAIENTWSRDMLVHQIESGLLLELGSGFAFWSFAL